jgi:quercetin dioxygenase-like cupin family protein
MSKYAKYIIATPKPVGQAEPPKDGGDVMTPVTYIDERIIPGAFYVECSWFWKPTKLSPPPHTHDFDEILSFFGSDPDNPKDLCGEVELWLGDEKHILTESCSVYVPKGLKHCPMIIRRADRPIFHFSTGTSGKYSKDIGLVETE